MIIVEDILNKINFNDIDSESMIKEFNLGFFNGFKVYKNTEPPTSRIRALGAILGAWWRITRDTNVLYYLKYVYEKLKILNDINNNDIEDLIKKEYLFS